ncbi:hypothetical protein [Burkholderia perseverans]|uniref:hypothetical protein n=1 Tax=Burkholderia perseverans TaxID=2615214 RepID=UPI001FEEEB14|nr:hypothetical protein [Burkholderia perseverans]
MKARWTILNDAHAVAARPSRPMTDDGHASLLDLRELDLHVPAPTALASSLQAASLPPVERTPRGRATRTPRTPRAPGAARTPRAAAQPAK